jgi:hypothetical protein
VTDVVWITASPRIVSTGAVAPVRLAGGGEAQPYYRDGQHFRAGVAGRPRFRAALGFDENGWTGGTVPTTANLVFKPAELALLNQLAALHWKDAPIVVEAGPEGGPWTVILTGAVDDAAIDNHALVLTIADLSRSLDKPVITARFAGTGGIEGGSEAKGRVKRRSWGRAFNIEGRILDKANNIYEFGDPAFPWQQWDALRDMGRDASPALATIAWQGSAAATLAALVSSVPAQGSGVVAPSICCAKWWTQPHGPLSADVRGEIGTGYVETVPEIAARVSAAAGGPGIANAATMAALRGGAAGLHIGDDSETFAQALDRLFLGVSLSWVLQPAGTIRLREWSFAAPVETLRILQPVTRQRSFAPVKTRRVGYRKAHRIHNDGEISAALATIDPVAAAALDAATAAVAGLGDDAVITTDEKIRKLIPFVSDKAAELAAADAKAVGMGTNAPKALPATLAAGNANATVTAQAGGAYLSAKTGGVAGTDDAMSVSSAIGGDIVLRVEPKQTDKDIFAGLDPLLVGTSWQSLDFAFYFFNNSFQVIENGALMVNSTARAAGDVFWIVRRGAALEYRRGATLAGSALLRARAVPAGTPLVAQVIHRAAGGSAEVRFDRVVDHPFGAGTGTAATDVGGGVFQNEKTAGVSGAFNADAVTQAAVAGDFALLVEPTGTAHYYVAGVRSAANADTGFASLRYGILVFSAGSSPTLIEAYENGVSRASIMGTYLPGDRYWIVRETIAGVTRVTFRKGPTAHTAAVMYTAVSAVDAAPMYGDTAFNTLGSKVKQSLAPLGWFLPTGERGAAIAAALDFEAYLAGLAPAWNNTALPTPVARGTIRSKVTAYQGGISALHAANAARAREWDAQIGEGLPETNADVTVSIELPPLVTFAADYQGALTPADQLPYTLSPRVRRGGVSIKTDPLTSYALAVSGVTGTLNNTAGHASKGDFSIDTMPGLTGWAELTVSYNGKAQAPVRVELRKGTATAPVNTGSGSKTANLSGFNALSTTTFAQLTSALMTVSVAAGESLYGVAPLNYYVAGSDGAQRSATAKWQYTPTGANSWSDFSASSVTGSVAKAASQTGPVWEPEVADPVAGFGAFSQSKATPGAGTYDVRLVGLVSGTGRNVTFSGTASIEAKI